MVALLFFSLLCDNNDEGGEMPLRRMIYKIESVGKDEEKRKYPWNICGLDMPIVGIKRTIDFALAVPTRIFSYLIN